eukprot:CAMPEP_0194116454 /NCGR_PEP_ID=MMETSP0150-20130528/27085_1 /TAXON_ID=122233 /ORGANISM="Chaetoceros debilis, Strain MM31A-1" /LENGTH=131 /DNA_ID=CAMNT_0038807163 /DNA_START=43 /DNA_END=438 /DNA_ORIENTATION=-
MKSIFLSAAASIVVRLFSCPTCTAFAPSLPSSLPQHVTLVLSATVDAESPELQQAIADVREAASAFGDDTAAFANKWIDNILSSTEGKQSAVGLLDECLIGDDDSGAKCDAFEDALKKLDSLIGVGATEQY